jgi:2-dehydro-3-deoxy-D-arabinonate dehydratase
MQLARYRTANHEIRVGRVQPDGIVPLRVGDAPWSCLAGILEDPHPRRIVEERTEPSIQPTPLADVRLLAPIDQQEVWAAGVTYTRSRQARMEESESAASCYDRVYASARPELFFKATPHRVAGPGDPVRIRHDSRWNVPEPELALVLNSQLDLVGFTVGNDMSSRDIEGDNPLYLPQAKVYSASCGLGPWVTLAEFMPPRDQIGISLGIRRKGTTVFEGRTTVGRMARSFEELIDYLGRDNTFPNGVILLTGTGIVPENDFTLMPGDLIDIAIDGIGTLSNPVTQSSGRPSVSLIHHALRAPYRRVTE